MLAHLVRGALSATGTSVSTTFNVYLCIIESHSLTHTMHFLFGIFIELSSLVSTIPTFLYTTLPYHLCYHPFSCCLEHVFFTSARRESLGSWNSRRPQQATSLRGTFQQTPRLTSGSISESCSICALLQTRTSLSVILLLSGYVRP